MSKLKTFRFVLSMEITLDPVDGKWERVENSCDPRLKTISPGNSFDRGNISKALRQSTRDLPKKVGAKGNKDKQEKDKIFLSVRPV
jgi:hypothetical protein